MRCRETETDYGTMKSPRFGERGHKSLGSHHMFGLTHGKLFLFFVALGVGTLHFNAFTGGGPL